MSKDFDTAEREFREHIPGFFGKHVRTKAMKTQLDGDMLFYLQSRGIPAARARQMLCEGFAAQVIERDE